jgi:hypothetical protein
MAVWKYSGKEVSEEEIEGSLKAVRAACFKCGKELHRDDCSIHQLVVELRALKSSKEG